MAHIINAKERNTAFWKFLGFFLLSTLLVVSAVYFDTRIPAKDNAIMREQISSYKTQALAQDKFVRSMDEAKALIDSLNRPGSNNVYLNQQIAARIRELAQLQYKDSSMYSRLNKNVLDVFLRYQEATNKVVSIGDMPRQLEDYKAKYEQAQRDLDNTRRDLDVLRRSNASTQGSF
ncbi:MAG TPA: type VI secretion system TssO [Puia sp.]|nr:type VI secretion system TssO [Puia sp.]